MSFIGKAILALLYVLAVSGVAMLSVVLIHQARAAQLQHETIAADFELQRSLDRIEAKVDGIARDDRNCYSFLGDGLGFSP